jgi:hypothetical protein
MLRANQTMELKTNRLNYGEASPFVAISSA